MRNGRLLTRTFRCLHTQLHSGVDTEVIVIGAGVVGLAIARQLAVYGQKDVLLLDSAPTIGTEASSRNSEVVHAGIYYPPGTLKAKLCVQGREALYRFCAQHNVGYEKVGKLVLATAPSQLPRLRQLHQNATESGVRNLKWLTEAEVAVEEPHVQCCAALLSPSTGVVDSHGFMVALQNEAEARGATLAFHSRVIGGRVSGPVKELIVEDAITKDCVTVRSLAVINAAGIHAQDVARSFSDFPKDVIPPLWLAKGNYFVPKGGANAFLPKFKRLCYPLPEPGGLGVHVTVDLGGGIRFGPDVEWLPPGTKPSEVNFDVDPAGAARFEGAIKSFCPGLPAGSLIPGYAGVRSKVVGPHQPAADFVISCPSSHNMPGVVNLYGLESPGLTSSLALAFEVQGRLHDYS
jgi:L-2-hydroxyglutarate oxidase LhgO